METTEVMFEEKQKSWIALSFTLSSLFALFCIIFGEWWWTLVWSANCLALYKIFNNIFRVYKDETKR